MRALLKRNGIEYGIRILRPQCHSSACTALQPISTTRHYSVKQPETDHQLLSRNTSADLLQLKWDQVTRAFSEIEPEAVNNLSGYKKQGELLVASRPGEKAGPGSSSEPKKRKVRVAPLRAISRRAQDSAQKHSTGDSSGDEERVYMLLACLREGDTKRAEGILWNILDKHSRNRDRNRLEENNTGAFRTTVADRASEDVFETCLAALLAAQDQTDLNCMMSMTKMYVQYLPKDINDTRTPPARCMAYILHCACELEDMSEGNKTIVEITYDWTNNYAKKLKELLQHSDILTEYDSQRISGVGKLNLMLMWFDLLTLFRL